MTKIKLSLLTCAMVFMSVVQVFAQTFQLVPNLNLQASGGFAPDADNRGNRTCFLITAAEMTASGALNGQQFNFATFFPSVAPNISVTGGTITLYMQNTADVAYTKGTTWGTGAGQVLNGMTQCANTAITLPNNTNPVTISYNVATFTYTGGAVYFAMEHANPSGTLSTTSTYLVNNSFTGLSVRGQSVVSTTPTVAATSFRPTLQAGFQANNDLNLTHIHTLGESPIPYGNPVGFAARVLNSGVNNYAGGGTISLAISGSNTHATSEILPAINAGAAAVVNFTLPPSYLNLGSNTVNISIPADDINTNNSLTMTQAANADLFSYQYPGVANSPTGVGVGVPGRFVAKFTTNNAFGNPDTINEIQVDFTSTGAAYNYVIWDATGVGGTPGTELYISPAQVSSPGLALLPVPDVAVSGDFYVGLREISGNLGFAYELESPLRAGKFYYNTDANPTWIDISVSGAPFVRLAIGAQLKTPVPPNCALYSNPANGGSACQNGTTLTWNSGGGGPTGYRVYFGANQALVQAEDPSTLVQNSAATSYATGALVNGSTYYWRVTAYNAQGDATGCILSRSFTAALQPCYCAGSSVDATFESITNVQSGAFSNPSLGTSYTNYFNLGPINNVNIGGTFTITVTQPLTQVYDEDRIYIFGDFNQDGDWNDAGELCGNGDVTIANGNVTNVVCTIPISALPGNTAFRIKLGDEVSTTAMNNSPCQVGFQYGEVEDYIVNITCGALASATNPACEGASLEVNATYLGAGTPVSYSWTTTATNGFTASTTNPTVAASASAANDDGVYTVVITDNNGCTSTADVTVAVNPAPQPQIGGGSPTEEVCEGLPLAFSSNNLAGGQTSTYSWSSTAANGFTSAQQNVSVTASASPAQDNGTYTVVITNQFLCTASASVAATVNPNPTLVVQSTSPVGCSTLPICDGSMVVVASGGTTPYQQYDDGTNFNLDGNFNGVMCFGAGTASVTDDKGCVGTVPFNIGAISTGPPSASVVVPPIINLPAFACNGTLVNNINVPSVSGATKYNWDGPAGTDFNGAGSTYTNTTPNANITFGALAGGASGYYIGVQAANACGTSVRKVQWVRGTLSVPTTSGPTVVCAGGSAIYSVTNAPITGAISYTWTGPTGTTFDGNPTPYTSASTSVTAVLPIGFTSGSICVTANAACISSATKCISVSTAPSALGPMSGVFSVCPPASQTYTVSNPGVVGGTYNWTLPANASGTSTSDNINVSFASGFTGGNISVTYTNVCGVTSAARTKSISIGTPSVPASITTTTTNGLCGQAASFSCPPQAGATFNWTFPAGSTPGSITGGSNSVGSTMPGAPFSTGQVCVTASNGCGTSGPRCITVKGAPLTPGLISSVPGTWCAPSSGIQFSADLSSLTGVYSLSWSVTPAGTATYVSGQATNTYTVDWDNAGPASVILTASNACGNASRSLSLNVAACSRISASNIVTTVDSKFTVYPNPAQSILNFEFNSLVSENLEVSMMDLSGRVVISETISTTEGLNTGKLDVSHLAKGVYTFKANSSNTTSVVRIVVE
ncbi:MAG TPA: T9SS type A sorting domain-containing protein [Bacteroidia bacterium]|nr:T9SS type A sorting domain-containing protein [Bacteroidia bacterium]HNU33801.1 T9SS type A sorting domain-containing protein [Bacteroidia bacterium]